MKKVFLYAYEQINMGDDLFIYNIVNRYPHTQFYLLSNKTNYHNFKCLKNLKIIDRESYLLRMLSGIRKSFYVRIINKIQKKCDAIVYIGGSIFIEYPTWKNICDWWEYMANSFPLYVLGSNFGPYTSIEYKDNMKRIFENVSDICFRDYDSYNLFKNVNTVRYASDILFSTNMPEVNIIKNKIFISLINCKNKDEGTNLIHDYNNHYISSLEKIIKRYLKDNYKVVLSGFCEIEGDHEVVRQIYDSINNDNLSYVNYNGQNMNEVLEEISSSSYVIGTRFHSIVLGLVANKPVFPIIYSNKTLNMLNDIGFSGNYIHLSEMHNLTYEYSKVNLINNYVCNVNKQIIDSVNHYKKLDEKLM